MNSLSYKEFGLFFMNGCFGIKSVLRLKLKVVEKKREKLIMLGQAGWFFQMES